MARIRGVPRVGRVLGLLRRRLGAGAHAEEHGDREQGDPRDEHQAHGAPLVVVRRRLGRRHVHDPRTTRLDGRGLSLALVLLVRLGLGLRAVFVGLGLRTILVGFTLVGSVLRAFRARVLLAGLVDPVVDRARRGRRGVADAGQPRAPDVHVLIVQVVLGGAGGWRLGAILTARFKRARDEGGLRATA